MRAALLVLLCLVGVLAAACMSTLFSVAVAVWVAFLMGLA